MTQAPTAKDTVLAFVDRINAHDVDGILALMDDSYRFVDSAGDTFRGRDFMRATWAAHFEQYPDYHVLVHRALQDEDAVALFGVASGTLNQAGELWEENHWEVPAAFLGVAANGRMLLWQVFSDTAMVHDLVQANESR
ncbi:MAG: nuclear transport factor 2 family protein [Phycisphaerae bacterium]|nr:nuclear transport factor 2 family protein [Tepidisphaeraceae bacterium]